MMFESLWSILHHMNFPADKRKILMHAKRQNTGKKLMEYLEQLPDQTYDTIFDVQQAVPPTNNLLSLIFRIK